MGRRIVFATIVALATAWPAAAAESPAALADAIVKAGLAQKTVHYRVDAQLTNMKLVQIADIGANAGIQRITLTRSGGPGHVTVIVVGANAYIRGDARTLVEYMGFKSAGAKRFANRWVLVPRGNAHFAAIAGDVTLGSAMRGLRLPGTPTALPPETRDGQSVTGLLWHVKPPGAPPYLVNLYARATGTPVPVEQAESLESGGTVGGHRVFSKWNEPLVVHAPARATPIAKTGLE